MWHRFPEVSDVAALGEHCSRKGRPMLQFGSSFSTGEISVPSGFSVGPVWRLSPQHRGHLVSGRFWFVQLDSPRSERNPQT